jgi:quinoprotein glucose dehydrogenase
LVHHDLWDYDVSAAPQLITVNHDGKKIDAVAVAVKNGFMFAFDRVSGKPLWPIQERPVPKSDIPGEQSWPTQPFPTVLQPFGRQTMTSKDVSTLFMTPEERTTWTKRIDSMGTGLYTPVSMTRETLAIPGAVGGASWGSTAADPEKGLVFVRTIDWPSVYGKVQKREPSDTAAKATNPHVEGGSEIYLANCQGCHGAQRNGGIGPQLLDLKARYNFKKFQQVVSAGKGEMPAFPHLSDSSLKNVYTFLIADSSAGRGMRLVNSKPPDMKPTVITGPVVASGGAPGGQQVRRAGGFPPGGARLGLLEYGLPYPDSAEVPKTRYFIPPGWGLGSPYIISPPWSSIVAYDMNTGKIKWSVPIGQDQKATEEGGKGTGVLRSQRNGMIVTSTGVLFCTAKDGKIYAFDVDNGTQLWAGQLPTGTQGLPSLYEVNGRHYLVVSATTPIKWGREEGGRPAPDAPKPPQGGYVVFTLP